MPGLNLTHAEAKARASLNVDCYEVRLDLTQGVEHFGVEARLRFEAPPGSSTFVDFVAPEVETITLNGIAQDVETSFDGTRIHLSELAAINTVEVRAKGGYVNTGQGLHRYVDPADGETYLYTQFAVADARRVFPVFDQPDLKAALVLTVIAPANWTVLSNETELETVQVEPGDATTHRFARTPPLASYLYAIVAGPYRGVRGELQSSSGRTVPLGVYCRASMFKDLEGEQIMDITRKGFEFYERKFDYPFPFTKYDQVFVPEFNIGAMEHPGCVTFTDDYVFRGQVSAARVERRATTLLHELAHMWFGDLVTMTWWNDLWLNESFATFTSALCLAESTWDPPFEHWSQSAWTAFAASEKWWAYRQDQLPSTHPIVATINDLEDVEVNFDGITYAKGASVLRQLVAYVGQEAFFQGIHAYFTTHAWGNTTLNDFLSHLEQASGRDLATWSEQWLERAGVNTIRAEVETTPDWDVLSFALTQQAPPDHPVMRPHVLRIGEYQEVTAESGDQVLRRVESHKVDLSAAADFEIRVLAGTTRPLVYLPNDDDLTYTKVRLDPPSWEQAVQYLSRIEDPLARSLVWGVAWDRTRDGEIRASEHVALILANIASETNSTVIQALLSQLDLCVTCYLPPKRRALARANVGAQLWELFNRAPAGSDLRFQLFRATIRHGLDDAVTAKLIEAFDGKQIGITIDQDLRWEILTALISFGRVPGNSASLTSADLSFAAHRAVDMMLEGDRTASGDEAAHRAIAAIPTSAAKRVAWDSVVSGDGGSNALQEATMEGLALVIDSQLLAPFASEYFPAVERLWRTRSKKVALRNVNGLYPTALAGAPLQGGGITTITQSWLEKSEEPQALTRLIRELDDATRRAERVQATEK